MDVSVELLIKNISINILFIENKESGITDRCQLVLININGLRIKLLNIAGM
jgi:hypothetical protein